MFINPQTAIDNNWVRGIANPKDQIQPNAIDFTLDHLYAIQERNDFVLGEHAKQMRGSIEMSAVPARNGSGDFFHLLSRTSYDGLSDVYVDLPEGVSALLVVRSTLNRNGLYITSGLYDSGYKGHIGFVLHNNSGGAILQEGVRVGQVIFVASENAKMYEGSWNHEEGTDHEHNTKAETDE